jgi:hypothetical protein
MRFKAEIKNVSTFTSESKAALYDDDGLTPIQNSVPLSPP